MGANSFFYGGIALAGIVLVGAQLRGPEAPVHAAKVAPAPGPAHSSAAPVGSGLASVTLERRPDSHFYADALVNGAPVRFLIDTGSSAVVLTRADARRAGIGVGDYKARAIGAGGEIRLMPVTLARLTLGPLAGDNVPAMVAEEGSIPVSLLGQSFLGRIGSVAIEGDKMVLR